MNFKISRMLEEKFGRKIVDNIVIDGKIDFSNFSYSDRLNLCDEQIKKYIQEGIINENAYEVINENPNHSWGFDFPGWLGEIKSGKGIMIIGQEPNIQDFPIQVVYGFSNNSPEELYKKGEDAEKNKLSKSGHLKIWYRIAELLKDKNNDEIEILKNCYITDLCHFAPSKSGSEKTINQKLKGTQKWKEIRSKIVELNLRKEVEAISPKIVLCQSNIAYDLLMKTFKLKYEEVQMSYPKKGYKIKISTLDDMSIIGIPHIGSNFNITNKFWGNHLDEVRQVLIERKIIKNKTEGNTA